MTDPKEVLLIHSSNRQPKKPRLTDPEVLRGVLLDTAFQVLEASKTGEAEPGFKFSFPIEKHQRSYLGTLKGKEVRISNDLVVSLELGAPLVVIVRVVSAKGTCRFLEVLKVQVESWIREKTRKYDR
jgi:hypothetical protein